MFTDVADVRVGMSSGGNSTGMAAYQHMPNSSGANSTSNMAASVGMHGIGNSPGMSHFISFTVIGNVTMINVSHFAVMLRF